MQKKFKEGACREKWFSGQVSDDLDLKQESCMPPVCTLCIGIMMFKTAWSHQHCTQACEVRGPAPAQAKCVTRTRRSPSWMSAGLACGARPPSGSLQPLAASIRSTCPWSRTTSTRYGLPPPSRSQARKPENHQAARRSSHRQACTCVFYPMTPYPYQTYPTQARTCMHRTGCAIDMHSGLRRHASDILL